ncbi:zinc ribbon domain-containing protein [Evansella sp. AB-rgal1]|uniref:zinc ribbon domain-containing protein n=1 Tax=Evansella sp. AB-rgal1 TaxID=3242696 RepID=UPI00359D0A9B
MEFCTNCGTKLDKGSPFCTECGAKMSTNQKSSRTNTGSKPATVTLPSFSRKTKIIVSSVIALMLVVFGAYKLGESVTDKNKVFGAFIDAIESGDTDFLAANLFSADDSMEVTEETVQGLLTYFQEYPYAKEELVYELERVSRSSGGHVSYAGESYDVFDKPFITFEQRGKKFFLYDNYQFMLNPQPLYIYTNYPNLTFFMNGEEVSAKLMDDGVVDLGVHLPGSYNVSSVLETDFMELEKGIDVNLFYQDYYELYLDIDYVWIESAIEGASIFINGKDTGATTSAYGSDFGPVLLDGSMEIHFEKESPFGKLVTPVSTLDEYYIYPSFTFTEETLEEVFASVSNYLLTRTEAFSNFDDSLVENATISEHNEISDIIQSLIDYEEIYYGFFPEIRYDLDSVSVFENEGVWNAYVDSSVDWVFTRYYAYSTPYLIERTEHHQFAIQFDERTGKWLVDDLYDSYSYDGANVVVATFEVEEKYAEINELLETASEPTVADFDELFYTMVSSYVDAVNAVDFSIVSPVIDPGNHSYREEVSNYIDYLETRGITQEFIGVEVTNIEKQDDEFYIVSTFEEYIINNTDGSTYRGFDSEYTVRKTDDGLKVHELLETNARN